MAGAAKPVDKVRADRFVAQAASCMLDRPAPGARRDVESLMFEVLDELQVFEPVVGPVAIDVVEMHAVGDWS